MDALHWSLFGAIGLLALCMLTSTYSHRQLERRIVTIETAPTREECRRAHVRLDNQQQQLEALARSHTRLLTAPHEE